jgi:hypothetical protein
MDLSFDLKELIWIIIALIIFEFMVIFPIPTTLNPFILLTPLVILTVSLLTKKIAAPFLNIKINYKIWEFQRYGWYERSKLKKTFPIGLVFPFLLAFLSLGIIKIFMLLQFDSKNLPKKRLLKKRGWERRSEINESDLAAVSAWGFYSILALAIVGTLPIIKIILPQLPKYAIFYGFWNLFPLGHLDGSKLFFGSKITWFITAFLFLIALAMIVIY